MFQLNWSRFCLLITFLFTIISRFFSAHSQYQQWLNKVGYNWILIQLNKLTHFFKQACRWLVVFGGYMVPAGTVLMCHVAWCGHLGLHQAFGLIFSKRKKKKSTMLLHGRVMCVKVREGDAGGASFYLPQAAGRPLWAWGPFHAAPPSLCATHYHWGPNPQRWSLGLYLHTAQSINTTAPERDTQRQQQR